MKFNLEIRKSGNQEGSRIEPQERPGKFLPQKGAKNAEQSFSWEKAGRCGEKRESLGKG